MAGGSDAPEIWRCAKCFMELTFCIANRDTPHICPIPLRRCHRAPRAIRPKPTSLLPKAKQGSNSTMARQHRLVLQHQCSQQPRVQL